jgi:magnesium-transporting ATPase (P-type)
LEKDGPNALPDTSAHPLRNALVKFWAPIPWLLEASILLQVALHKYLEASVIAGLLVFNAALAYFQESRAQVTLTALKSRLALNAYVQRDGIWKTVPAIGLVLGDLVKLSLGGVVAADVRLVDGSVSLDQSILTGESLPFEAGPGVNTDAGALVRRGEATAMVTATGAHTKFGRTAELVRTAHVVSSQQKAVLRIVRNLAMFNAGVILLIGAYAYTEATATDAKGGSVRIIKGAFAAVAAMTTPPPANGIADDLEKQGFRVLAVAAAPASSMRLIGLIALSDPPRKDSASLISELRALGVRTVMVTGDAPATAAIVAHTVGLAGAVCPPGPIPDGVKPSDFGVFASVLPEGKYHLVKSFQKNGCTVGMCGDGANDAPALRQAQIGIAVSTATDVAKSAAGVVLTGPGLAGIVAAVKEGRVTFQRILTYTLNSILKKIVQVLLLAVGLIMTGHAVLTPMLMVIVMITGDFLAMSLATDRVRPSGTPNAWQIGRITSAGVILGGCFLVFCAALLALGKFELRLGVEPLRTLVAVSIVYGSQATLYAIRERHGWWGLRPTIWLILSSITDLLIISALAICGIAMAPLPISIVGGEFAAAVVFGLILAGVKIPVFSRLEIP